MDEPAPQSAAYFNEQRDFWWKADYLQLVARRLRLSEVSSALDVGAGIGHWGRALMALLSPDAHLMLSMAICFSPLVAIVSPRWWPSNVPTRGHRFSPRGWGAGV
jgi:hypothetical protein